MNNTDNQTPSQQPTLADLHDDSAAPANRPMSALAQLYKLIEDNLRRNWLTVAQLNHVPEIAAVATHRWQVKGVIKTLMKHDVLDVKGATSNRAYHWKKDAPPFTLTLKIERAAAKEPSVPVTTTPEAYHRRVTDAAEASPFNPDGTRKATREDILPGAPQAPQKPLELIVNGLIILVDQNPETGNDRIVIERIWGK